MNSIFLPVGLVAVALLFFAANRSIGLFSWSRLEALSLSRAREKAVEQCLEERELVITCFNALGSVALVAAAVLFTWAIEKRGALPVVEYAIAALILVWVVPEVAARVAGDKVVIHLVPLLYKATGTPFRALRRLLEPAAYAAPQETGNGDAEAPADAAAGDAEAYEFFKEAVRLRHTPVREIMTPRTDMVSIADTETLRRAAELSMKTGKSRVPVFEKNRDQIVGVLHVKDLLAHAASEKWDEPALRELARQPFFVPETKTISELMHEFQRLNTHMGIVLDEYGGTAGLVTLEDVLEELIGEIHDEHEEARPEEALFRWAADGELEVQAVMRVEEFNDEFDFDLPDEEDFDTLGGFVMYVLGKIPEKGESFRYGRAGFTVVEADPRHVIRLRVRFDERRETGETT